MFDRRFWIMTVLIVLIAVFTILFQISMAKAQDNCNIAIILDAKSRCEASGVNVKKEYGIVCPTTDKKWQGFCESYLNCIKFVNIAMTYCSIKVFGDTADESN